MAQSSIPQAVTGQNMRISRASWPRFTFLKVVFSPRLLKYIHVTESGRTVTREKVTTWQHGGEVQIPALGRPEFESQVHCSAPPHRVGGIRSNNDVRIE